MIKFNDVVSLEDYGLLLQDGCLTVTKTIDEVIYLNKSINVNVLENVNVKFVDQVNDGSVCVNILDGANVNYQILNSCNGMHDFKCYGNLNVMQVSLGQTVEKFNIELLKEEADANILVLALGKVSNLSFIQNIVHNAKNTYSNISNFGISMNGTDILFDTTGKINKGMSKSICKQLSKGVVMDDDSAVTSRPILLIDEYDVIANHGASIGKMSDESLFYLMSRGLTKTEAFLLILEGILRPFIEKIMDEEIKNDIENKIRTLI